jgi:hypothetical protein
MDEDTRLFIEGMNAERKRRSEILQSVYDKLTMEEWNTLEYYWETQWSSCFDRFDLIVRKEEDLRR